MPKAAPPEDSKSDTRRSKDRAGDARQSAGRDPGTKDTSEGPLPTPNKARSVSFNRDVHVKRFGTTPREVTPRKPLDQTPLLRKEPFTSLSEQELIDEAARVLQQADSVSCTAQQPPDKFFSLPYRKKHRQDPDRLSFRRKSEDLGVTPTVEEKKPPKKSPLGRSTSDVGSGKSKKPTRTSLSTLFFKQKSGRDHSPNNGSGAQKEKANVIIKRSKSDVTDRKSNSDLQNKQTRRRSGSISDEYLAPAKNKKVPLSPIIEINQRDDYFKQSSVEDNNIDRTTAEKIREPEKKTDYKVNPVEKPPRISPDQSAALPKPPKRIKTPTAKPGKESKVKTESEAKKSSATTKNTSENKKNLIVDEIDVFRDNNGDVKKHVKETIQKLKGVQNIEENKNMVHSSQQPPDKPPLTKGHTVDNIVKILKQDQLSPPPKAHLISPPAAAAHNNNQPFSYTRPSVSPDPNLYVRPTSPTEPPSPVNKMNPEKGVVYAQVVCNQDNMGSKQTVHKTYSPSRQSFGHHSDEDEGLGYEDHRNSIKYMSNNNHYDKSDKTDDYIYKNVDQPDPRDSPITPRFKLHKPATFIDYEPTYANHFAIDNKRFTKPFIDTSYRGRADGMDSKRNNSYIEPEVVKPTAYKGNDLSFRRELLESRMNARRMGEKYVTENSRYIADDYDAEVENRMRATEKYVDETARYCQSPVERGNYIERHASESQSEETSNRQYRIKYNSETGTFEQLKNGEIDRREFLDRRMSAEPAEKSYFSDSRKCFPPEPEYEPPSLERNKPVLTPDEYVEKKYKLKSRQFASSHDALHSSSAKYTKSKHDKYGSRRGHYASNPEIAQEREDDYVNSGFTESFHSSLKREKQSDNGERHYKEKGVRGEEKGSRRRERSLEVDYPPRRSPYGRFDNDRDRDNKLVDSGIENDFRKDSNGDINRGGRMHRSLRAESDDEGFASSLLIASERQHTEDNFERYMNEYPRQYQDYPEDEGYPPRHREYGSRERDVADGPHFDSRKGRPEGSLENNSKNKNKLSAKPPKATKKMSGLEKVKKLFSRDSSKKSAKERTRVLRSPERPRAPRTPSPRPVGPRDIGREPSRDIARDPVRDSVRDSVRDPAREPARDSVRPRTLERSYEPVTTVDYSQRRRLATPSPTPSPPRRPPATGWMKTLDHSAASKTKSYRMDKESILTTTEDESSFFQTPTRSKTQITSPTKSLRFFGDTDPESGESISPGHTRVRSDTSYQQHSNTLSSVRKNISNSASGLDELDRGELANKSRSLSNLNQVSSDPNGGRYKRNLHNISEIHSNSETESQFEENQDRRLRNRNGTTEKKPPLVPFEDSRRSRSQSRSNAVLKSGHRSNGEMRSNGDMRSNGEMRTNGEMRRVGTPKGSDVIRYSDGSRESSGELRRSRQELNGSRTDLKPGRRRAAAAAGAQSAGSSTEGESSHQSQRSVVYLHATTVGDIPGPARSGRGHSREDVSSVNSSQIQVKTVSRSFSLLAPWRPKHRSEEYDVNYAQTKRSSKSRSAAKPSEVQILGKSKSSSTRTLVGAGRNEGRDLEKSGRSISQSTLTRRSKQNTPNRITGSSNTLFRKSDKTRGGSKENVNASNLKASTLARSKDYKRNSSNEAISRSVSRSDREKLSRSVSMPKDTSKKAGWFKISNKNKKQEQSTRIR